MITFSENFLGLFLQEANRHTGINPDELRSVVTVINPQKQKKHDIL